MDIISVEGMEFHSYIGCFDEEKVIGTRFLVDVFFEIDATGAKESDDLHDTVNYQNVYLEIKDIMQQKINLLEHAVHLIEQRLMEAFPEIQTLTCKIRKMNPPLGGQIGNVSFESTVSR